MYTLWVEQDGGWHVFAVSRDGAWLEAIERLLSCPAWVMGW